MDSPESLMEIEAQFGASGLISYLKGVSGRECGECSLCCKLPPIKEPDFKKPENTWCQFCQTGSLTGGCSIYEKRPDICQSFACMWLINPNVPDFMKPLDSHMVFNAATNPSQGKMAKMELWVDPAHKGIWRKEPYWSYLVDNVEREIRMMRSYLTVYDCKEEFIILGRDRVINTNNRPYILVTPGGVGRFWFVRLMAKGANYDDPAVIERETKVTDRLLADARSMRIKGLSIGKVLKYFRNHDVY